MKMGGLPARRDCRDIPKSS